MMINNSHKSSNKKGNNLKLPYVPDKKIDPVPLVVGYRPLSHILEIIRHNCEGHNLLISIQIIHLNVPIVESIFTQNSKLLRQIQSDEIDKIPRIDHQIL